MQKEEFLMAMRYLAASVSVFSAKDDNGKSYAMSASSVTSLTVNPPALLICVNQSAGIHSALRVGSDVCINILSNEQQEISNLCSSTDSETDRFANEFWNQEAVPFLKDAQASIFCSIDQLIPYHSHTIVIAQATSVTNASTFNTLMYADGRYLG